MWSSSIVPTLQLFHPLNEKLALWNPIILMTFYQPPYDRVYIYYIDGYIPLRVSSAFLHSLPALTFTARFFCVVSQEPIFDRWKYSHLQLSVGKSSRLFCMIILQDARTSKVDRYMQVYMFIPCRTHTNDFPCYVRGWHNGRESRNYDHFLTNLLDPIRNIVYVGLFPSGLFLYNLHKTLTNE